MGTFIENPVLQKEVRGQLRARRQTRGARVAAAVFAAIVVLLLYYYGARAILTGSSNARDAFVAMVTLQLTLVLFLAPSLTASAISQEREQQTWNALLLSRLSADEIVVGKIIARLLPAAAIVLLFVPLTILAAFVGEVGTAAFVLSYLLIVFAGVFYAAVGLFFSWAYRRTVAATSATFGVIAFFVVGTVLLYSLWAMARTGQSSEVENFPLMWLNPYLALSEVFSLLSNGGGGDDANRLPLVGFLVACVLGAAGLIAIIIRRLSHGPKELEQ